MWKSVQIVGDLMSEASTFINVAKFKRNRLIQLIDRIAPHPDTNTGMRSGVVLVGDSAMRDPEAYGDVYRFFSQNASTTASTTNVHESDSESDSEDVDAEFMMENRAGNPVKLILIRRVPGSNVSRERFERVFRNVPRDRWRVFDAWHELWVDKIDFRRLMMD